MSPVLSIIDDEFDLNRDHRHQDLKIRDLTAVAMSTAVVKPGQDEEQPKTLLLFVTSPILNFLANRHKGDAPDIQLKLVCPPPPTGFLLPQELRPQSHAGRCRSHCPRFLITGQALDSAHLPRMEHS